nr:hypothetical protein [Tanacetum cinerariifolium]
LRKSRHVAFAKRFGIIQMAEIGFAMMVVTFRSVAKSDICKWMKANSVRAVDPTWKFIGFLIDDAAAETDPIRHVLHSLD